MEGISQVTCPNCSFQFSVEDVLAQQIEDRVRGELQQKLAEKERQLSQRETAVLHMREQIDCLVEQRLAAEKESLTNQLKQNLQQDYEIQIQSLNDENEGQKTRIQQLLAVGIENERLKRKFDEREQELRLEYESKVTEQLRVEAEKIARRESEKNALKFKEKDILIEQLNVRLSEAQMKIQQGSIQLQGEAQELALEELLGDLFPFDSVKEIKKGQKGADVLQEIRDGQELACGKIYYESKRTKTFGGDWIQKLKEDNQRILADVCVLVTQAMPDGIEKVGWMDGVWVCSFQDVKWLSMVLRQAVIQIHAVGATQANKGEKVQMLYAYLTSNEFRMQFEAIVEGFKGLQDSYNDEKLKMQKIWKEREKQLERVLINAVGFYGAIKGIASDAIPAIKMLEDPKEDRLEPVDDAA